MLASQNISLSLNNDIVPDDTLKTKVLIDKDGNISGGIRSKNNQFYSFIRFSIGSGSQAYFIDPGVSNILVRVTGNQASLINGILGVSGGDANLFLLNPNGISFGTNASLLLNGSFIATTGDSVVFNDGSEFSVAQLKNPSLLNVNIPIGIRFGKLSKSIENRSNPFTLNGDLRVAPKKTLALLGGDVSFVNGFISSPGSRIELGSVAANSFVKLKPHEFGWQLGYELVSDFKDIRLSNFSGVLTFGGPVQNDGGDIVFQGRRIHISDQSEVSTTYSGNLTIESGGSGGSITINASDWIAVSNGASVYSGTFKDSLGDSGNINIKSPSIFLDGGIIESVSDGSGRSGNIEISADQIYLFRASRILTRSDQFSIAGNINIKTGFLSLTENSLLSAGSRNSTQGGNIDITSGLIVANKGSEILAESLAGFGGQIEIKTKGLFLSPDTVVSATSGLGISFDGSVDVEVTDPDPRQSFTKLPTTIVDTANLISQDPCRRKFMSEFSNIGRGGLPPTLDQDQSPIATQVGLVEPPGSTVGHSPNSLEKASLDVISSPSSATEAAQGWQLNPKGEVVLLAYSPDAIAVQRLNPEPQSCPTP